MTFKQAKVSFKKRILIVIGWVNLLPIIIVGWCSALGLTVVEMQWVGALVTGVIGSLMLLILYTPVQEDNRG